MQSKSVTFSLFKIMMKNTISFEDFFEGFKKGPKGILKNLLIILCFIYCIGCFGYLYISSSIAYYNMFEMAGAPEVMTLFGMLASLLIIFIFGFLSVASNYYTGNGEEQFLSMPLSQKNVFGAKFCMSFVTDALLGIFFSGITAFVYGIKQHIMANPLFYIGTILSGVAVAIFAVFVLYLLFIVVLTIFPRLRKRKILTGIAVVFLILFALAYSLFNSKASVALTEGSYDSLLPLVDKIVEFSNKAKFLQFFSNAVKGNILSILVMAAIICLILFCLVPLLAPLYIKSLNGFSDVKSKKLNAKQVEEVVNKEIKSTSVLKALYWRDVKSVLREPVFFSNGPLIVFLFPVILVFSFGAGFLASGDESISSLINIIRDFWYNSTPETIEKTKYYAVLILTGMSAFIGNSTCLASTSFSREGKAMYDLKALPVENEQIVTAKFYHALSYVIVAVLIISLIFVVGITVLAIPLSVVEILKILGSSAFITIIISILIVIGEMFLDTLNPKLKWENPMAAFKQNVNSIISVFGTMIFIGIIVALCIVLPKNTTVLVVITIVFGILDAVLGNAYFKYAAKKITLM